MNRAIPLPKTTTKANLKEIRRTIKVFHESGDVVELRAIGKGGEIASGFYDDFGAFARGAQELSDSGKYIGVYFTANPCKRDVLQRRKKNTVHHQPETTTKDEDVESRSKLIFDIDPIRESGTSATKKQRGAAHWCLVQLTGGLRKKGWPDPVTADSGNGYYAIYAVDEPNNSETKELFKQVTKAAAAKYSIRPEVEGEIVKVAEIDEGVFNAARLIKAFGTVARKGKNTSQTPHRLTRLFNVPAARRVVSRKQLEELATTFPAKKRQKDQGRDCITPGKIEEFLNWAKLEFQPPKIEADGGRKWILEACPFNPEHTNSPAVFLSADGIPGFKCFHENTCGDNHWNEFRAAIEKKIGSKFQFSDRPYYQTPAGLFRHGTTRNGKEFEEQLTNFSAEIIADIEKDDGVEILHRIRIEASIGERKKRFDVDALKFQSMTWPIEKIGAEAAVMAGMGTRDHARVAIQLLSTNIDHQKVYTHTGWRLIGGDWFYLHGAGAIGSDGLCDSVTVMLPPSLKPFRLPEPPTGDRLKTAVRASLQMRNVGPHSRTLPIYTSLWRGALSTCNFSLHMTGETGTFKSSFNALALEHFGKGFNRRKFPANWMDTENNIGQLQFILKDAPIGIDDFLLKGGQSQIASMHAKADRVFRGQGNEAGRGRMMRDGITLREPAPPRGVTLSTGEDVPRGESLQARVWNLDVSKGDIDFEKLKACQKDGESGLYAETMSAYLRWIAPRYAAVRKNLVVAADKYCQRAVRDGQHAHTPEIVGNLMSGLDVFLEFAADSKAISGAETEQIRDDAWKSLLGAAAAQTRGLVDEDPARRFFDLISAALQRGDAHLGAADTGVSKKDAKGKLIGWISSDQKDLYLLLDSAFAAAQELARQQQESFTLRMKTMGTRLRDRNFLTEFGKHRNTVQKKIGAAHVWVLCVRADDVLPSWHHQGEE